MRKPAWLKLVTGFKYSRYALISIAFTMALGLIIPFLPLKTAYAYQNNDALSIDQQHARTKLYAIGLCFELADLSHNITGDNLNDRKIWGGDGPSGNDKTVSVGHEIDTDDGLTACANLDIDAALGFIGMTWKEFRDIAWESEADEDGYYHKKSNNPDELLDKKLQELRESKRQSDSSAIGPKENNRRNAVALSRCIQSIPKGKDANNQTVKVNGTRYQYRDGKNANSEISIGHDMDSDGRRTCGTLVQDNYGGAALRSLPKGTTIDDLFGNPLALIGGNANAGSSDEPNEDDTCDFKINFSLAWIVCPIIDWGGTYNDFVFSQLIKPLLEKTPLDTDTQGPYYGVWQTFRFLGNVLLIGSMLMIVYAQAKGDQ